MIHSVVIPQWPEHCKKVPNFKPNPILSIALCQKLLIFSKFFLALLKIHQGSENQNYLPKKIICTTGPFFVSSGKDFCE